jgi:hypothetical protein
MELTSRTQFTLGSEPTNRVSSSARRLITISRLFICETAQLEKQYEQEKLELF